MQTLSANGQVIEEIRGWLRVPLFPTQYLLLDATSPAAVAAMFSVASCKIKLRK